MNNGSSKKIEVYKILAQWYFVSLKSNSFQKMRISLFFDKCVIIVTENVILK